MTHRVMAAAVVVVSLMPVPAPGQTPDLQGHWQHDEVSAYSCSDRVSSGQSLTKLHMPERPGF